jgi:undecaprenyl-diphosphatase
VLVAALCILLALFGFIKISEELGEGKLAHLDEWVLHLLRVPGDPHTSIGPSWLLEAAQDITSLGGRTMLVAVTLFTIGYLALERKYGAMWLVGVATAGGGLLTTGMKELFGRERPDLVPHLVAVTSPSFPGTLSWPPSCTSRWEPCSPALRRDDTPRCTCSPWPWSRRS